MAREKVKVIKVAARANERKGNSGRPGNLGTVKEVSGFFEEPKGKKILGNQGYMLVSDWEQKNFPPYEIQKHDILIDEKGSSLADTQINHLSEENERLMKEIERLKSGSKSEDPEKLPAPEQPEVKTRGRKKGAENE